MFNLDENFKYMFKSKTKPWDDKEMDLLDGFKVVNFFFGTISTDQITAFAMTPTMVWTAVHMVQRSDFVQWIMAINSIDAFLFFNVFMLTNRCYQILDAKAMFGESVTPLDYVKIIMRKLCRTWPAYLLLWIFTWCLFSRAVSGPNWYNAENAFVTCERRYMAYIFFYDNLLPQDEGPWMGCMPQAHPIMMDMQFTVIIPFLAYLTYKLGKSFSILLSLAFIGAVIYVNFKITDAWEFKLVYMQVSNYNII